MAQFNASNMTSGEAVQAIHAGINTAIINYTLNETASGSTTIALSPLPGGARVLNVKYLQSLTDPFGTGDETISIYATIGGTNVAQYINTATSSISLDGNGAGLGTRLTASANLMMAIQGAVGTGTASTAFRVIATYITQDDPD